MARSDKSSDLSVKVSWNAPIDTLMRFFIVIIIEECIQSFKELGSIISRTDVNIITFNCSPKPFDEYIVRCTASTCLLYTSDAADDLLCVDLGGRRIIKKKK